MNIKVFGHMFFPNDPSKFQMVHQILISLHANECDMGHWPIFMANPCSGSVITLDYAQIKNIPSGGVLKFSYLVIIVFHRGPNGPPSRSDCTRGVQLLLEGVHTSISKET